MTIGLADSDF